ncbi:PKD domain-containing protein [Candidatus Bipolaricaulota bacterium]
MRRARALSTGLTLIMILAVLYGCALFNRAPIASFDVAPISGPSPLFVEVNASSSIDPDGDTLTYSWDFGDGSFGSGVTATHTYPVDGQYTIRLTVMDSQGQPGTAAQTISVAQPSNVPAASFVASPSSGGTPLIVAFNGAASSDPNGSIVTYMWSFGDGSTGSGSSVLHTYATQGSYTCTLTVTDDEGLAASMSMLIVVIDGGQGGCT